MLHDRAMLFVWHTIQHTLLSIYIKMLHTHIFLVVDNFLMYVLGGQRDRVCVTENGEI